MRRLFSLLMMIASSLILISCETAPTSNTAKPANAPMANAPANTATATAPAASSATAEADIKKLIGDLSTALSKNDTAALEKIYSEDYHFVGADGVVQTRAQRLDGMKSGDLKIESITFGTPKVRVYGDSAIAIYDVNVKQMSKGKDASGTGLATIMLVKGKDGWRVVNGQPSLKPVAK